MYGTHALICINAARDLWTGRGGGGGGGKM